MEDAPFVRRKRSLKASERHGVASISAVLLPRARTERIAAKQLNLSADIDAVRCTAARGELDWLVRGR